MMAIVIFFMTDWTANLVVTICEKWKVVLFLGQVPKNLFSLHLRSLHIPLLTSSLES